MIDKRQYSGDKIARYNFGSVENYTIILTKARSWRGIARSVNNTFGYEVKDDCFYSIDDLKKMYNEGTLIICKDGVAVLWL